MGEEAVPFLIFVGILGVPVLACLFVACLDVAHAVADRWRRRRSPAERVRRALARRDVVARRKRRALGRATWRAWEAECGFLEPWRGAIPSAHDRARSWRASR